MQMKLHYDKNMNYNGYSWIKVKKYVMDESKTWEDRYKELEKHHIEETTFLIEEVRKLAGLLPDRDK
jgi:hypothetical protein